MKCIAPPLPRLTSPTPHPPTFHYSFTPVFHHSTSSPRHSTPPSHEQLPFPILADRPPPCPQGTGSFISLPLLECMVPARAAEAVTATPRRSAFIYLANGVHSLNYQITAPGKDYKFSRSLMPLEKHRDVITPISGLHHPASQPSPQLHQCLADGWQAWPV